MAGDSQGQFDDIAQFDKVLWVATLPAAQQQHWG